VREIPTPQEVTKILMAAVSALEGNSSKALPALQEAIRVLYVACDVLALPIPFPAEMLELRQKIACGLPTIQEKYFELLTDSVPKHELDFLIALMEWRVIVDGPSVGLRENDHQSLIDYTMASQEHGIPDTWLREWLPKIFFEDGPFSRYRALE
jgi:hypothetical protein